MLKLRFEIEFVFENGDVVKTTRGYRSNTELEEDINKDVITYRESDGTYLKVFRNKLNMIKYKEV